MAAAWRARKRPASGRSSSAALAERRELDREHGEAVVEVGAERAARDHLLEVPVRRGDDPHVHLHRLGPADALDLALLEGAQQPHLDRRRARRPPRRGRSCRRPPARTAPAPPERAGEGPLLVAEELALDEALRDRAEVHRRRTARRSAGELVDHPREPLLAGAGLAADEHGRGRRRDEPHALEDVAHRGALGDVARVALHLAELLLEERVLRSRSRFSRRTSSTMS